jgi:hypothetical protein
MGWRNKIILSGFIRLGDHQDAALSKALQFGVAASLPAVPE